MSIEYTLYISNNLSMDEVDKILQKSTKDIVTYIGKPNNMRISIIEDELNFTSNVFIKFVLGKFNKLQEGKKNVLRATLDMLKSVDGDLALLFNGEEVLLIRSKGVLVLNSNPDLWTDSDIVTIDVPYESRYIPIL
jgi:hypothetical protein